MKRQFLNPPHVKGYQLEQMPSSRENSSADLGPFITPEQPQRGSPPPTFIPRRPVTNGLASSWNMNEPPPSFVWNSAPVSLADQETVEQDVIQRPTVAPTFYAGNNNSYAQTFASGAVSPHQSAITPLSTMFPNSQSLGPSQTAMPMRGLVSDPLLPLNRYNSQTLPPPVLSPPWQLSPSIQQVPQQGQGGGPPPFVQPPSGEGWNRKPKKKRRVPIWAKVILFSLLFLILGVGGVAGYYWFFLLSPHVSHIVNQQVTRLPGDDDPNATRNGADILSGGRINILLLGSDTDEKFSNGNYLAQTDIVVTIDPATKSVGMLSIPRDFWINVPGSGMHKLDEAYGLGGVALSRLTIYQDFGIPINYYAWVGLDGFVKVIDTVGGIDVDVIHPITDDNYPDDVGNLNTGDIYALKRLYIPPGPQHLSGQTALEYVRSRHADLVGDFGRSARQQEVLGQLKTKLNNPDIIGKLPEIASDLDGYVKTDMQLGDVFKLLNFARALDSSKINRVILSPPYSALGVVGNKSVVFPNCEKIVPVIAQMFALGDNARCNIQANTGISPAGPSSLASASTLQASYPLNTAVQTLSGDAGQSVGQIANTSVNSMNGNVGDLFGIRSLLDLLFLTVFDSPGALQV